MKACAPDPTHSMGGVPAENGRQQNVAHSAGKPWGKRGPGPGGGGRGHC